MGKSLDFRKDNRSKEVFGQNIEDYTERERCWSIALRHDFVNRGMLCDIKETGVDNTGALIEGNLKNYNADKTFVFKDGHKLLIEIKTAPEYLKNFFTFKVFSLKECLKQQARIVVPRIACYYLFGLDSIEHMLTLPAKIYEKFSPNDPAIRIYMDTHMDSMLKNQSVLKREWTVKAKKYIEENKDLLTRDKAT